jgi:hypothetical protein
LEHRLNDWPFAALDEATLERALARARKRVVRRRSRALGECGRELRHELRRKLRRFANLRRAATVARDLPDPEAKTLLRVAQSCGHEGDVWMAIASARRAARSRPGLRPVLRALEAERLALCRRHDRALEKLDLA